MFCLVGSAAAEGSINEHWLHCKAVVDGDSGAGGLESKWQLLDHLKDNVTTSLVAAVKSKNRHC